MIWLTWRQFRAQTAVIYAALAALAVVLAVTGPRLLHLADTAGSGFLTQASANGTDNSLYYAGSAALLALPAVIGMFWGAPLVARELDAGTHRLVWNQSITRTRWLATKLGLTGLVAVAAAGGLSLTMSWWCRPIDKAVNTGHSGGGLFDLARISPVMFDARGIAPVGYAAFAFALGVAAGAVIRRAVPAMAITVAVFVAVQVAMPLWVRPHLVAPTRTTSAITAANLEGIMGSGPPMPSTAATTRSPGSGMTHVQSFLVAFDKPGSWKLSNQTIDATGQVASHLPSWVTNCLPPPGTPGGQPQLSQQQECFAKLAQLGYRQRVTYQPANHYWALQWSETAVFLALALSLTGLCFWWTRRRLS
jgi:hypothetical protein